MQTVLAGESATVEKGGIKLVMNGNMEVTSLTINPGISTSSLEGLMKDCINDAIKKIQKIMAQKMQEMGGIPGLN